MGLGNLGDAVIIIFIFTLIHLGLALSTSMAEIEKNWDEYKCNPGIIPFAGAFGKDPNTTFDECIKEYQADFMGVFLEPIYTSFDYFAQNSAYFATLFKDIKLFGIGNFDGIQNLADGIKNRFHLILTEFNVLYINISDAFNQLISVMTVLIYTVQSGVYTAQSIWRQLPGTLITRLSDLAS
tara:strand:- start:41 stop:586 length:546 start_codon:yes stop_codon:yes gene_type:complete